jgi:hypothetical protein
MDFTMAMNKMVTDEITLGFISPHDLTCLTLLMLR